MGKRIESQRRGKGSPLFKSQRRGVKGEYHSYEDLKEKELLKGEVVDLIKESGRNNILARVLLENDKEQYVIASEGLAIGDGLSIGNTNEIKIGNILFLKNVPEGCPIFNIELEPGDGGTLVKATGGYALLVTKEGNIATVKMPSGEMRRIPLQSRATIGCVAGGMRMEKPFIKAGNKYHAMKSKTRKYQLVRGVAKNAVSHPHGGEQHHAGKSKSVSRHAVVKVGTIASKRTGRRKK